jgi:hypothetical protein
MCRKERILGTNRLVHLAGIFNQLDNWLDERDSHLIGHSPRDLHANKQSMHPVSTSLNLQVSRVERSRRWLPAG